MNEYTQSLEDALTYDLSVVVPVYNEVNVVDIFYKTLSQVLDELKLRYEVIFIDDGSHDGTFEKITNAARQNAQVIGFKLSRNFGKDMALLAGLSQARGAYIVMIDGDLQHPPELIPELWRHAREGADIVYTVRTAEEGAGWIKRFCSRSFYKLFSYLANVELEPNTTDFKLISRKVCDSIIQLDERDLFLRGMFSWVGFSRKRVEYRANRRVDGVTKYNFQRLLNLSISGITSFSTVPIRLSLLLCGFSLLVATAYSVFALYSKYVIEVAVSGWTSLLILMSLFCSGLFIMLGIIGEYVAKIHIETKKRPRYIIDAVTGSHS